MTIEEIKSKITFHELAIKTCFEKLNESYDKLEKKCIEFMKEDIKDRIESEVKNQPDITKELGIETLKTIKSRMNDIILKIDETLPIYFRKQYINKHETLEVREGDTLGQKYNIPQSIKSGINSAMRKLLSPVGEILIEYGYESLRDRAWKRDSTTDNKLEYAYGIGLSNNVEDVIKEYSTKCQEMFDHMCEIDKLRKQKEKQEAEDLWNQA